MVLTQIINDVGRHLNAKMSTIIQDKNWYWQAGSIMRYISKIFASCTRLNLYDWEKRFHVAQKPLLLIRFSTYLKKRGFWGHLF
jgi:hypothetical protein